MCSLSLSVSAFVQLCTMKEAGSIDFSNQKVRKKLFRPLSLTASSSLSWTSPYAFRPLSDIQAGAGPRGLGKCSTTSGLVFLIQVRVAICPWAILFGPHASRPALICVAYNSNFLPAESNSEGLCSCKS